MLIASLIISTDQCMDGEALVAAFGVHPGPDCLKDVLPRFGQRVKVYNVVKSALGAAIRLEVRYACIISVMLISSMMSSQEEVVSVEETSESDCASTDILSASTRVNVLLCMLHGCSGF